MKKEEAINAVYNGRLVNCTKEEYHSEIRHALQDQAGKWIDQKQDSRAVMALEQIRRLDLMYPHQ